MLISPNNMRLLFSEKIMPFNSVSVWIKTSISASGAVFGLYIMPMISVSLALVSLAYFYKYGFKNMFNKN